MHIKSLVAAAALSLLAGAAFAAPAGLNIPAGGVMVDGKGMTVYVFDNDTAGSSTCYDDCAVSWPPMLAKDGAKAEGDFTLTPRQDGAAQWAYKSMPLYYWAGDAEPGDMTGDNVGGVWHVVK